MPLSSPVVRPTPTRHRLGRGLTSLGLVVACAAAGAVVVDPPLGAPSATAQTTGQAGQYRPMYVMLAVRPGETAHTPQPGDFSLKPFPAGVTVTLGAGAPAWVTVEADNSLTYSPGADVSPAPYVVPLVVHYADGTSETVHSSVVVQRPEGQPQLGMLGYSSELTVPNPGVIGVLPGTLPVTSSVPAGTVVTLDRSHLPAHVSASVNPDYAVAVGAEEGAAAGEFMLPMTVAIPGQDPYRDEIRVQILPPKQASTTAPSYPASRVLPGATVVVAQTGATLPSGTVVSVDEKSVLNGWTVTVDPATGRLTATAPAGAALGDVAEIRVRFTYPDASEDTAVARVTVGEGSGSLDLGSLGSGSLGAGSVGSLAGVPLLLGSVALGGLAVAAVLPMLQGAQIPGLPALPALPGLPAFPGSVGQPGAPVPAPGPEVPNGRG